jgi:cytochrome c-type biogenesis protein CcmF
MISEIGQNLVGLSLILSLYCAVAAYWGIRRRDDRWALSAQRGMIALAGLLGAALLLLLLAFLTDDFAVRYVAQHSATFIPVYLKISAVWAGQEGSLLLWCAMQALFAALATARPSEKARPLVPWATVFLSLITAFFVAVTALLSNPFVPSGVALTQGQGLNPLLRHPGMIFHPPALYVGYVGLAVPFAFAMGALVTRKLEDWTAAMRTWTLVAWLGLGVGLLLGMRWAYDVLGWGGYWGWDPVENAGLLPWFTATALVHGAVMQEERRGFQVWNVLLAVFSFALVLFGTFATRSGMIQSVHAYAQSDLGSYFLSAIAVTLIGSFALLLSRRKVLASPANLETLLSRDGMFFLTLVVLSLLAFSVFIGSVLPTITALGSATGLGSAGALASRRFEAGPAWFDRVTGPQFGLLVLLIGVCPLLGRATAALSRLKARAWLLVVGALGVPLVLAAAGLTQAVSLVGFSVVGLAGVVTVGEIADGAAARSRRTREAPLNALWHLIRLQRRKYGGYLVHVGVVLMAIGVIGTRLYPFEVQQTLQVGQPYEVGRYTLVYEELRQEFVDDHSRNYATISVYVNGEPVAVLEPRLDRYSGTDQSLNIPAVRPMVREDLYLILAGWSDDGAMATVKIVINSLVNFLWLGGLVFLAGGALALWPPMQSRTMSVVAAVVGLSLLAGSAWAMWGASHGMASNEGGRPLAGQEAPDFRLALLDGGTVSLKQLRGQVVLVNFWASWCPPCQEEMPALQATWEEFSDRGVSYIGIAYQDERASIDQTVAAFGTTYPVGVDAGDSIASLYGITGVPETFIVDQDGRVAYVHIGPVSADLVRSELSALLASVDN